MRLPLPALNLFSRTRVLGYYSVTRPCPTLLPFRQPTLKKMDSHGGRERPACVYRGSADGTGLGMTLEFNPGFEAQNRRILNGAGSIGLDDVLQVGLKERPFVDLDAVVNFKHGCVVRLVDKVQRASEQIFLSRPVFPLGAAP